MTPQPAAPAEQRTQAELAAVAHGTNGGEDGADLDPTVSEALRLKKEAMGGAGLGDTRSPRTRVSTRPQPADERDPDELSEKEANDTLALMLSCAPPALDQASFKMGRLTRFFRDQGKLGEDEHFWVTLRGLEDDEIEKCGERAMRLPTSDERIAMGIPESSQQKIRDELEFRRLAVTEAMIDPNLHTPEVMAKGGKPEQFVAAWFAPGELGQLWGAINELSGWGVGAVERAKKS